MSDADMLEMDKLPYRLFLCRTSIWKCLRVPPVIHHGNLLNTIHGTKRSTILFRPIFAMNILDAVACERNTRVAALLRTVVNQPILANIEIARTRPAPPLVRSAVGNILLKINEASKATLTPLFRRLVNVAIRFSDWFQLP